ncbi:uncharacterized protein LOC119634388 [Glossina fuscipes]|uniref:Uncharacterized protein LOC119634388 n=1 Tax=Glossina fuscipes TaxID=7396 RepID=A0A8U0WI07_9MUSC|nr:uncharacterized protein LOC119634388 [Glossina fuscipes]KAI9590639.1 hypothetical protein GQX74_008806 [Glossina fuscipes]
MSLNNSVDIYLESEQEQIQTLNKYIHDIHQQLVDYEESLTPECSNDDNDSENNIPKIMDLLNEVADINEAAKILRPINLQLDDLQSGLTDCLKSLQQTIDLLKLERDIKILTERNEGMSSEED